MCRPILIKILNKAQNIVAEKEVLLDKISGLESELNKSLEATKRCKIDLEVRHSTWEGRRKLTTRLFGEVEIEIVYFI